MVSIVIVNWRVGELVGRCVRSIIEKVAGIQYEILVIDNSPEKPCEEAVRGVPNVTYIPTGKNLGFAGGCNVGIERAKGEYILLLNPDTEFVEDALAPMIEFMRAHPKCAVAGCRLVESDGQTIQPSVRRFPTLASQLMIMLKLHHLWRFASTLRRYFADDFDYTREQQCDQVMGSFFLMSRRAIEQIGALDLCYFIWFEEVDWCKMARDHGWEVWYTPRTKILHHGGMSFAQVFSYRRQSMLNESMRKYFYKYHGLIPWFILTCFNPLSLALAWLVGVIHIKRKKYSY